MEYKRAFAKTQFLLVARVLVVIPNNKQGSSTTMKQNIIALGSITSKGLALGQIQTANWNKPQPYEGKDEDGNSEPVDTNK